MIHEMLENEPVLGVLTDLIALSISIIFTESEKPVHFVSSRVTDPRAVILRLLLLLCDADMVAALIPKRGERVAVVDDTDAAADIEAPVAVAADEIEEEDAIGGAKDPHANPSNALIESCLAVIFNCKLEEEEREKENEIKQNYLWECRRCGFAPLTASELNKRNSGSTQLPRSPTGTGIPRTLFGKENTGRSNALIKLLS